MTLAGRGRLIVMVTLAKVMAAVPGGRYALIAASALLIGVATVAGAWLARRHAARREVCLGAAAGALLVIAGVHMLPDAWSASRQLSPWLVPAVAAAAFAVAGVAVRYGCACPADRQAAGGSGAVVALTAHRLLEGAVLALAGSVTVALALTVHAIAEGLAAGTLLTAASRRRRTVWLVALCASPVAGAVLARTWAYPAGAQPVLLAIMAGVLGQAARVSLTAAFRRAQPIRLAAASPAAATATAATAATAAATVIAAAITVVAVHAAG